VQGKTGHEWSGFGTDGLGDAKIRHDRVRNPEKMNAVWKIIELVKAYPNQIEMVCLGPLTNLALAIRLEPTLPRLLKRVVVMSGTLKD